MNRPDIFTDPEAFIQVQSEAPQVALLIAWRAAAHHLELTPARHVYMAGGKCWVSFKLYGSINLVGR